MVRQRRSADAPDRDGASFEILVERGASAVADQDWLQFYQWVAAKDCRDLLRWGGSAALRRC